MSKLDDFLGPQEPTEGVRKPEGVEWFAAVQCQLCNEPVYEQTLYPAECILVWTCSKDHRSFIENYNSF